VSFWSRLFRRGADAAERGDRATQPASRTADPRDAGLGDARAATKQDAAHERGGIERLARIGEEDGPDEGEAIARLREARGTPREAEAIAALVRASGARALPDAVAVACADLLAARGEEARALALLEGVADPRGLVLAADLEASTGRLEHALAKLERALARDLDAPGARDRHARWSAALGVCAAAPRRDDVTLAAPSGASTPFRLLREVDRGGAGTVYEAEDLVLGRRVAFKVHHRRGGDREALLHEARLAVALAGPGVVRLLDVDPEQGWVALEWIARGSVRDAARRGDLEALCPIGRWARPLARALARIHAAGYVHGDVKPANVLLRALDDPVLTDFGLGRPRGAPSEGGSAGYVSPERLAGAAADPRDDVFGFGRLLEHVLVRLEQQKIEEIAAWRSVAALCVLPAGARPEDGAALLPRIDALFPSGGRASGAA
jgi:serine/threonine-protein kinase